MIALADTSRSVVAYSDGSGGCNRYTGTYGGEMPAIAIGPFAATRMFCSAPEGAMAQESAFFAALTTAATYSSDGATLQLLTAAGETAVELAAQRPGR